MSEAGFEPAKQLLAIDPKSIVFDQYSTILTVSLYFYFGMGVTGFEPVLVGLEPTVLAKLY